MEQGSLRASISGGDYQQHTAGGLVLDSPLLELHRCLQQSSGYVPMLIFENGSTKLLVTVIRTGPQNEGRRSQVDYLTADVLPRAQFICPQNTQTHTQNSAVIVIKRNVHQESWA